MINIILNRTNFNEEWAYEYLHDILAADMHVLIMPLFADEGWADDSAAFAQKYHRGSRTYEKIAGPFHAYQITDEQIQWFNPYLDDRHALQSRLQSSSLIYLIGNDPDDMMECIEDKEIQDDLRNYAGIFMSNASGSKIMMDEYASDHAWNQESGRGLGILQGFSLETGYIEDEKHLHRMIRSIEEKGRAVFGCPDKAGILIRDGHYDLMGDAFICSDEDLDHLYQAYEDARSRQEYYGDNGGW